MNLLLTGASGFLGRNVILRAPRDWHIAAVYCQDNAFPDFVAALGNPRINAVRCDLAEPEAVAALVRQLGRDWDCCLYLAGRVDIPWSVQEPRQDLLRNTGALLAVLESVHVQRMIYFSSGAVYDGLKGEVSPNACASPTLPYAVSKLACEQYVRCFHERRHSIGNYLVVRFFGAYGPYEAPHKIYTRLVRAFAVERRNAYTIYGDGRNLIDAMYVDDAVDAINRMIGGSHWNDTVNLASGHPMAIEALVREAGVALGVPGVHIEKQGIAHENIEFRASTAEMREHFGFEPRIGLAQGILRLKDFLVEGAIGGR